VSQKENNMNFEEIDILNLLPQRPPFVMIDTLLYCDIKTTRTSLSVEEENIFCEKGLLTESGLIENIAQTCAARMGYINKYIYNDTVKLGFIGAIRNLKILRLPKIGEQLITQINTMEEVFQMTLVNASVMIGDETIAACEMKISITNIEKNENE
jgi:predicted hotdog family 3-hydroxylacyl-ACP dehydratase